jgi:tetratricopeptide (TPR) repeat protein
MQPCHGEKGEGCMSKLSRLVVVSIAAAIACGHAGMAVAAKDESLAEPRLQLGKKFRNEISAAQTALAARDYATVKAALAVAKPLVQTADEQYVLDQYDLNVAQMTGDRVATAAALDRLIASGTAANQLTQADKARYYANQGEFLFQAGHYARAEKSLAAALAAGNRDPQMALFLAESQLRGGRTADAVRNIRLAIDSANAAGGKAPAEWYARGIEIASRARLTSEFVGLSSAWLAAYPDRETWYVVLAGYRQLGGLAADADRDLLRLTRTAASPAMFTLKDYLDHSQSVSPVSLTEAVTLLREGIAAGKISQSENATISKLLTKVDPKLAAEKKKLAGKLPAATGYAAVSAQADALYGIREFAKAAELYRAALAQPGADAAQGNVRLAAALAQSGDKAGALAALNTVTGGSYAPIAAYWRTWIEHPAVS